MVSEKDTKVNLMCLCRSTYIILGFALVLYSVDDIRAVIGLKITSMYTVLHNLWYSPCGKTGAPIGVMLYIILKLSSILIFERKNIQKIPNEQVFTVILRKSDIKYGFT